LYARLHPIRSSLVPRRERERERESDGRGVGSGSGSGMREESSRQDGLGFMYPPHVTSKYPLTTPRPFAPPTLLCSMSTRRGAVASAAPLSESPRTVRYDHRHATQTLRLLQPRPGVRAYGQRVRAPFSNPHFSTVVRVVMSMSHLILGSRSLREMLLYIYVYTTIHPTTTIPDPKPESSPSPSTSPSPSFSFPCFCLSLTSWGLERNLTSRGG
jgi:hypothetical protein